MDKEEIIGFLSDMIDALTWRRAMLVTLFGAFILSLYVGFENRSIVLHYLLGKSPITEISMPWEVTEDSKKELHGLVKLQTSVGAVLLTEVDLKKNRKVTKYWYTNDAAFREQATNTLAQMLPQAFFDNDSKNNAQMLDVLANRFSCVPTEDTVFIRFFPDMPEKYPYICRLAVPPFAGEFAGFITLGMTRAPAAGEVESLKIEISRISIELYLRDIGKLTR